MTLYGTIDSNGTLNGTWTDEWLGIREGTWKSTSGKASCLYNGSTGFSGFKDSDPELTFTTDEYGSGSWHLNLKDADFSRDGDYKLSVWVNGGGRTILISDNFTVHVD